MNSVLNNPLSWSLLWALMDTCFYKTEPQLFFGSFGFGAHKCLPLPLVFPSSYSQSSMVDNVTVFFYNSKLEAFFFGGN